MASVMKPETKQKPIQIIQADPLPERYARGWHCLGLADDFKGGGVHGIDIFGTRVVVFENSAGELKVLTAWCPHMGADLALGHVEGDSVVCKFHGWTWGGDGKCTGIPYAKTIPPRARTQAWETCEQNKLLFIWHDAEGNGPTPDLDIPRIDEVYDEGWSDWSVVKWKIDINCRELLDNVADLAHFRTVHGSTGLQYFANIFEGHRATQIMVGTFPELGGENDLLTTVATYFGPAYQITHMFGQMQGMPVESILMNSHTPIDQNSFELRFGVIVKKFPGMSDEQCDEMVKGYVEMTNKAFGEDVEIWHNKTRVDNPLLCDGDGPVFKNRQWYDQFYQNIDDVSSKFKARKVHEINMGLEDVPPLKHAFEG